MNRIAVFLTTIIIGTGLASGAAAGTRSGLAAGTTEDARGAVAVGDLDLSSEAGRRTADERARRVIHRLCSTFADERKVDSGAAFTDCFRDGWARAQAQINALATTRVAAADVPARTL
jgi:UrcA family protein